VKKTNGFFTSLLLAGGVLFVSKGTVFAQTLCPTDPDAIPTLQCAESIFNSALKAIFALAGVVAFVVLVMGGFKYITAGGDEKAVGEARKMLTGAITGLILVVAVWGLLSILSYYIFNSNALFTFKIPG
jgi:hypothetical protein